MEQSNQSKKVLLSVIGIAILVVAVVGVSFAFFSYTTTGGSNEVQTGTIVFTADNTNVTLTNVFPVAASEATTATSTVPNKVLVANVSVSGETTYASGIDFDVRVGSVNVKNSSIKPRVTVEAVTPLATGVSATVDAANSAGVTPGQLLAHGTIAANETVSDATILRIKAYYDKADYHISDNTKQQLVAANLLDDGYAGTIVSTSDWNALTGTGENAAYSFTINVRAVEGNSGRLS